MRPPALLRSSGLIQLLRTHRKWAVISADCHLEVILAKPLDCVWRADAVDTGQKAKAREHAHHEKLMVPLVSLALSLLGSQGGP